MGPRRGVYTCTVGLSLLFNTRQGVDLYTNIEWIYTESHEDQIKVRESLPFVRVLSNYLFF